MSYEPPKDYRPEAHGCRCDVCPLRARREGNPVPPEMYPDATLLVVGDAPGEQDVAWGRPFCGPAGNELGKGLAAAGVNRRQASYTSTLLCRAPGGDLEQLLYDLKKENRRLVKAGLPPRPTPQECCRPRLLQELRRHTNILAVGNTGLNGVVSHQKEAEAAPVEFELGDDGEPLDEAIRTVPKHELSIMALRGAPIVGYLDREDNFVRGPLPRPGAGHVLKVLPTMAPSFVLRRRRWTKVFRNDLSRAVRWFEGKMGWKDPVGHYQPTPDQLRKFLAQPAPYFAYDVETDARESLTARLRCIGVSTGEEGMVVPVLGIDGKERFYTDAQQLELDAIWRDFFLNPAILKVGHHAGMYDAEVIKRHYGVMPGPLFDTLLGHQAVDSELPHDLGFVGRFYTDVTAWKAAHTATQAKSNRELWAYNLIDCIVTYRVVEPIARQVEARQQTEVLDLRHHMQRVCLELHENGMAVDQEKRGWYDAVLRGSAVGLLKDIKGIVGDKEFNPGSFPQVREQLYTKWGLTPHHLTDKNEPSTDDDSIRALLLKAGVELFGKSEMKGEDKAKKLKQALVGHFGVKLKRAAQIYSFLDALRWYRRRTKYRGTYVRKLVPNTQLIEKDDLSWDADEEAEEEQERKSGRVKVVKELPRGLVMADGRVHPQYNAHGTTSGRLSSSRPNSQNLPRPLRGMFIPRHGFVYVYADMDQLEMRFIAALSGCVKYIDIFLQEKDCHALTAEMIFGKEFLAATGGDWDRMRDFAKIFCYAVGYGAEDKTVHESITSTEDAAGNLVYAHLKPTQTAERRRAYLDAAPEIERWWPATVAKFQRQGYLADPISGHKRDFLDSVVRGEEELNDLYNFESQAGGAHLVHKATLRLTEGPLYHQRWGPGSGLVQQGHDALIFEVPLRLGRWACKLVTREMSTKERVGNVVMPFTAKAKLYSDWNTELKCKVGHKDKKGKAMNLGDCDCLEEHPSDLDRRAA